MSRRHGGGPPPGRHGLLWSFRFALRGVAWGLRTQRNLRIHFAAAGLVLLASAAFPVSRIEGIFLLGAVVAVPVAELFNTALEAAVNLAVDRIHPLARVAKDVAAAAVLLSSVYAVGVGLLVFGEHLLALRFRERAPFAIACALPFALALAWPLLRSLAARRPRRDEGSPRAGG